MRVHPTIRTAAMVSAVTAAMFASPASAAFRQTKSLVPAGVGRSTSGARSNIGVAGDIIVGASTGSGRRVWHGFLAPGDARTGVAGPPAGAGALPAFLADPVPNPASHAAMFRWGLASPARDARLDIFDVAGRRVASLLAGPLGAGSFELRWDLRGDNGARIIAGVYFVRLRTDSSCLVRRMVALE